MKWPLFVFVTIAAAFSFSFAQPAGRQPLKHVQVRGIYGGIPSSLVEGASHLPSTGVNAIWIGSKGINQDRVSWARAHGAKIFAEFNTLHDASLLKEFPDAAPIGADGQISPPPEGWQGICPTHPGYRLNRMTAFRRLLADFEIDGIWLDYHHSHASWERAVPLLPDTCFCQRCRDQFQSETGTRLPNKPVRELSALLLGEHRSSWVKWRCDVFTDWVREFREILDTTRPTALLGTFHCPWSDSDYDGALRDKLAIDLRAQARYVDVFSPMPYHARFGHATDPAWISRQTRWLGTHLHITGIAGERLRIWPIVQLADWGEPVPGAQVHAVLDHGTRLPATGVMVFAWSRLEKQPESVQEMVRFYQGIQ